MTKCRWNVQGGFALKKDV